MTGRGYRIVYQLSTCVVRSARFLLGGAGTALLGTKHPRHGLAHTGSRAVILSVRILDLAYPGDRDREREERHFSMR
jgi:hypothetical protein